MTEFVVVAGMLALLASWYAFQIVASRDSSSKLSLLLVSGGCIYLVSSVVLMIAGAGGGTGHFYLLFNTSGGNGAVGSWVSLVFIALLTAPVVWFVLRVTVGRWTVSAGALLALSVPLLLGVVVSEEQPSLLLAGCSLLLPTVAMAIRGRLPSKFSQAVVFVLWIIHLATFPLLLSKANYCSSQEDCFRMLWWTSLLGVGLHWIGWGLGLSNSELDQAGV